METHAAAAPEGVDANRMAQIMKALANPVRLELLQSLRRPQMLAEIRLQPARRGGGQAGRPMSRVAVRQHLDRLLRVGVVATRAMVRDGRTLDHYVVDHRQVFALTEELRQLARLRPEGEGLLDETQPAPTAAPAPARGPRLVLVNGIREGQVFALDAGRRSWLVGRGPQAHVLLDYDPYVSLENARIEARGEAFFLEDLPSSRNGTRLNWRPLERGVPQPLGEGDAVGVGRSTLVFRRG